MKNNVKGILASLGLCAGMIFLAACAPSMSAISAQSSQGNLAGTVWSLSTLIGQPLVPGTAITALFIASGKVGGSSGCNQYSGTYTVAGSSMQISSPIASTMMACELKIMNQEDDYLKALGMVRYFSVTGNQLTLMDGNKKSLLIYKAQSQDLAGTSWLAISYNNGKQAVTSVMAGTALTAKFGADGTLSGSSGCNTYNGPYKVNGSQITIGPLASTRKACSDPAGVMEQETQYLAALQSAATYQIEGTGLELRTKDGALSANFVGK